MKFSLLVLVSLLVAVTFAIETEDESIEDESFEDGNFEDENFEDEEALEENKKKPPKARKEWAVLVAGSDGWGNYRHQADICHAYHILINRGVPASNIIVLMKDDIANNPENPTPGVLINKPNGTDVYKGVKIDYKGKDVNPKTFLNVLLGNKKELKKVGSGRVLESGPNDDVFINFADHGGPGVLCFPDDDLSAKDFISTLNAMTKKKKYAKLLLFIEACESGSMFDNLLAENTKILASTAAAYDESSWGYYCDYRDYPCLGDMYSINWMEHFDKKIPPKENIFEEYQLIRTLTSKSHSNLYGDYSIGSYSDSEYVGPHNVASSDSNSNQEEKPDPKYATAVSSRDITLHWLKRKVTNAKNSVEKLKYSDIIAGIEKKRTQIDNIVDAIVQSTIFGNEHLQFDVESERNRLSMNMLTCYENLYRLFSKKCFNMFKNPYVVKHFYKFVNICHMDSVFEERATNAINTLCNSETQKITETH